MFNRCPFSVLYTDGSIDLNYKLIKNIYSIVENKQINVYIDIDLLDYYYVGTRRGMKYVNHNDMENPGFNTIENTSYIDKIYDMDFVKIISNSIEYHGYIKKILDSGDIQVKLAGDGEIKFTKYENNDKNSLYLDLESQIYIQEYHTNLPTNPIMYYQLDKNSKLEFILPNDNDLILYYNDGTRYRQPRTRIHRLIRNNKKMYKGYFRNYFNENEKTTEIHDIEVKVNYEADKIK